MTGLDGAAILKARNSLQKGRCDLDSTISLAHPERFDITGPDGEVTRGADQDWYPDFWQRRAGCGPTAAAVIFSYLAATRREFRPLCPENVEEREAFTRLMCRAWQHITPTSHGLNRPEMMAQGMEEYARAAGVSLTAQVFEVPAARTKRPDFAQAAAFVRAGLEQGCPVAFLNLCRGKVKQLDRWHWVTIIAMKGDQVTILDSGNELDIDLALWYATTKKRGGFVWATA